MTGCTPDILSQSELLAGASWILDAGRGAMQLFVGSDVAL